MIDFTTLQGLTIPEGVVTQITDENGRVIWAVQSSEPIMLEVEKITSDTYAGETTYTGEQFILLDIYPKTNGTVKVTYGGLTKTITDTSGAEEPNAQQVFFGTFNGVSDSVTTPASGTLTIEGDCRGFGCGPYAKSSKSGTVDYCLCVTGIVNFGAVEFIPDKAFGNFFSGGCEKIATVNIPASVTSIGGSAFDGCTGLTSVTIPDSVTSIGGSAFYGCTGLTSVTIPDSVTSIGYGVFNDCTGLTSITVASGNTIYYSSGNCLIETETQTLIAGCNTSVIPASVTSIGFSAFGGCTGLTSVTIPDSVTSIGGSAFRGCSSLTSATFANTSGWYVTKTEGGDISTGTAVDLNDPANNATLFKDTYSKYYWYRS